MGDEDGDGDSGSGGAEIWDADAAAASSSSKSSSSSAPAPAPAEPKPAAPFVFDFAHTSALHPGMLRLRGTSNVHVADASVFPHIPNGNVHSTVVATAAEFAERLSQEMLREDPNLARAPERTTSSSSASAGGAAAAASSNGGDDDAPTGARSSRVRHRG